eukprot:scaffold1310_cov36-Phaeocystis_antarctica.AAC.2
MCVVGCAQSAQHRLVRIREWTSGRNGRDAACLQGLCCRLVPLQAVKAVLHLLGGEQLVVALGVLGGGRHNAQARDVAGPRRGRAGRA